jgi:hypothetical protein
MRRKGGLITFIKEYFFIHLHIINPVYMHTILLTTDTAANAKLLADFLSTVKSVKSVSIDPKIKKEKYNWTNPSRPATDEEFEQMIQECEKEKDMTLEEAQKLSSKKIKKWIKEQKTK